jgi:hypothetical protein
MTPCTTLSIVAFILIQSTTVAFFPVARTAVARAPSTIAINLVPDQGWQLVAFSQDYFAKKAKESASKASHLSSSRRSNSNGRLSTLVASLVGKDSRSNHDISHEDHVADDHQAEYEVLFFVLATNY